jgi:ATP-dependent Clp protease protease subunit
MRIQLPLNNQQQDDAPQIVGNQNSSLIPTILMTSEIEPKMASAIVQALLEFEAQNIQHGTKDPIQLLINSPGGDLYSTFMICDVMSSMITPVHTVGFGQIASGGILTFMNGTKGHRTCSVNTQFMSHRFMTTVEGSHTELKHQYPEFDRIHERIVRHYIKCTKLSQKVIEKNLLNDHNVWLSAAECLEYNICDNILDTNNPKFLPKSILI